MNTSLVLFSMTVFGLLVAGGGTLVGVFRKITEDVPNSEKKRITRSGRLAIALILLGLAGSLATTILKDISDRYQKKLDLAAAIDKQRRDDLNEKRSKDSYDLQVGIKKDTEGAIKEAIKDRLTTIESSQETMARADRNFQIATSREAHHTREIVIAGQPLRSMAISWAFPALTSEYKKDISDGRAKVEELLNDFAKSTRHYSSQQGNKLKSLLHRGDVLMPFLNLLGGTQWTGQGSDSVVALFALDDSAATVLPLGYLAASQAHKDEMSPIALAAGVDTDDEINAAFYPPHQILRERSFASPGSAAVLVTERKSVKITWALPAADFFDAVDKVTASLVPTAQLPDRMRVVILTRIKKLPVDARAMAVMKWPLPWGTKVAAGKFTPDNTPLAFRNSKLTLTPNGLGDGKVTYNMQLVSINKLENSQDKLDENDPNVEYCYAALWIGTRSAP